MKVINHQMMMVLVLILLPINGSLLSISGTPKLRIVRKTMMAVMMIVSVLMMLVRMRMILVMMMIT